MLRTKLLCRMPTKEVTLLSRRPFKGLSEVMAQAGSSIGAEDLLNC